MIEFLTQNALYVVLVCAVIIWAGMSVYLFGVDRKISELEKQLNRFSDSKRV